MSYKKYLPLAEKAGVTPTRSPIPCRFSAGDSFSNAERFSCDGEWMKVNKDQLLAFQLPFCPQGLRLKELATRLSRCWS